LWFCTLQRTIFSHTFLQENFDWWFVSHHPRLEQHAFSFLTHIKGIYICLLISQPPHFPQICNWCMSYSHHVLFLTMYCTYGESMFLLIRGRLLFIPITRPFVSPCMAYYYINYYRIQTSSCHVAVWANWYRLYTDISIMIS
jgi:hypothetical protein